MSTLSTQKLQAVVKKDASWVVGALKQFGEDRCAAMAASIAFYSAFSLAPTLVMVIAVAGWVFGAEAARGQLFHQVNGLIGDQAAAGVQSIVENAHRSGGTGFAAIISFVLLAVGASATFSSLNTALNLVWPVPGDQKSSVFALVRVRLISFGLVLGVAFLLIVSLVLDTAIQAVGMWLWGDSPFVIIGDIVQLIAGLMILTVAFGALLKLLPDARVEWRDALVGGVMSAVLFSAGKKLFAFYLTHAGTASAFGAAGSLAVLLMWLYFSAAVLLLGAEFSAARARLHDPRGAWGVQNDRVPPGSRAKIGSLLASSTRAAGAATDGSLAPAPGGASAAMVPAGARRSIGTRRGRTQQLTQQARAKVSAISRALAISRKVARAETTATRVTADALIGASRKATQANEMVRRHPWRAVLVAASAGMAVALLSNRDSRRAGPRPPSA
ncbi:MULTISPECIES: YihY/virulence factor BrkB family protein [unclassified Caballeronia]|uniref:YihY/virulence factor BrkB family protein n=1 Tax=unclassified Caballeronia TaxID=2646786 RepID=UPI002856F59F|nr:MULTISPECIES: YihY/virulence factor BrkB family protein [unclassified Caballeronia]MDR5754683.1 YihY/virulence factor BrkB family protein [Caballeronia sp. LZ024]MDR5839815.1 YihY/virulence factor BrkB family protein [Caballeronia sp. LZ031]